MKRIASAIFLICLAASFCCARRLLTDKTQLRPCDLLFHVSPGGGPITDVAVGADDWKIDHVAIYLGDGQVIEAVPAGVVITPVDSLFAESGFYLVGRVTGSLDRERTLARARRYLGRPYDFVFLPDNEEIYCSELVQFSFVDRKGRPVFEAVPMSFHDESGEITEYWRTFYRGRGLEVPEGQPGTHPGELSRRRRVKILYRSR